MIIMGGLISIAGVWIIIKKPVATTAVEQEENLISP